MRKRGKWIAGVCCTLLLLAGPVVGAYSVGRSAVRSDNERTTQRQVLPISGEKESPYRQAIAPIEGAPVLLFYVELLALQNPELRAAIEKEVAKVDTQLLKKDLDEKERAELLRQKILLLGSGNDVEI